jgi:poly(A)-specific ribonuclease
LAGGNLASIDPKWFSVAVDGQPAFIDLSAKEKELDDIREALKEKPRTLVGHNLFTDLIFIYKTFIGNLPDKVTDFSKLVHEIFPQVIDTKYLSTYASGVTQARSGLKPLFDELQHQIEPVITLAMEHMDYLKKARDHEAGYDSWFSEFLLAVLSSDISPGWMTAQIFLKLSVNLAAEQSAAKSRHNEILRACYENDLHMLDDQLDVLNPPNTDGPNILVSGDPPVEEEEEQSENSDMEEGEIVDEGLLIDISCHDTPQAGPEKKTAKVPHFIPHLSGPFWRRYANRLRVYGTEAEVCNLESESA